MVNNPNSDFKGLRCYKCGGDIVQVNYAFSFEGMNKLKK
jgi:hypothetical protein